MKQRLAFLSIQKIREAQAQTDSVQMPWLWDYRRWAGERTRLPRPLPQNYASILGSRYRPPLAKSSLKTGASMCTLLRALNTTPSNDGGCTKVKVSSTGSPCLPDAFGLLCKLAMTRYCKGGKPPTGVRTPRCTPIRFCSSRWSLIGLSEDVDLFLIDWRVTQYKMTLLATWHHADSVH